MLRLRNLLVSSLRAGAARPLPTSSLLRRLFLCTDTSPAAQFVSHGYLISTCGLTPAQALTASKTIPNATTTHQADAVRAFLAGDLGLSESDVTSTIARKARLLCCDVDKTLAPCVSQLRGIGLSTPEIARLLHVTPLVLVSPKHVSRLAFYMSFLGSFGKVLRAMSRNKSLLGCSIEDVVEPNIVRLRQCGLTVRDIAQVLVLLPRLLTGSQERLEATILRAEQLGVPRCTPMFRHALVTAYAVAPETATTKMELLRSLGLSSGQVAMAVAKMPSILGSCEDRLRRAMDFLTKEVGMDMEAIARSPSLLAFSIEERLAPRLKVLKLLKENGLPGGNRGFYNMACLGEETFLDKFVRPHEKSIPAIAAVYAAARAGKAPAGAAAS
ncbi:hypothetical protein EJB05_18410, partial [Eragrostis curvula]